MTRSLRLWIGILLVLSIQLLVEAGKDYYKVLDVPKNAPLSQIKKHFKKLSRVYHPDKNPNDATASEKFMEIAEAYEVLSNEEKRNTYDRFGEEGLKQQQQQQQNAGSNPFGNIFSQFFGGQPQGKPKTANIEIPLQVSLEDIYNGANIEVDISKQVICNHCFGSGAHGSDSIHTCGACQGQGHVLKQVQIAPGFVQQFQQQCDKCQGKGKVITKYCKACNGHKINRGNEQYTVTVERGMSSGQKIVFEEESNESPDFDTGDVVFTLKTTAHPTFERRGNDLYTQIKLSLIEALAGFSKSIEHLDQTLVKVSRTGVTQYGFVEKIDGAGMPFMDNHDQFGDMFVEYLVEFPETVDQQFIKDLQEHIEVDSHWLDASKSKGLRDEF
ncbi:hypothetical protein V8B55DRAFT_1466476 [Mucor lusitanicus]|uniref:DnaJ-domain-containing protein n=1 Tax=Mucor circinelloides f. lusitanicus TaxID=29924 RepID=A0A8H4BRZ9_MUCCL|nr:hypothetical protein FB192DRAFT_1296424 [Mucor lusitanicus]